MGLPRIGKHRRGGADYKSCIKQNRDDKYREERSSRIGKHRNGGADYKSCIKQNRDDKDREDGVSQDQETLDGSAPTTSRARSRTDTTRIGRMGFLVLGNLSLIFISALTRPY